MHRALPAWIADLNLFSCVSPAFSSFRYDDLLLMIVHNPELLEQSNGGYEFSLNQVSIFVLSKWNILVTFQEHSNTMKGNWSHRAFDRVRNNVENVRSKDLSHLLYAVLDSITDRYFPLLEFYGDRMEELEGALIDDPNPDLIKVLERTTLRMSCLVLLSPTLAHSFPSITMHTRFVWYLSAFFETSSSLSFTPVMTQLSLRQRGLHVTCGAPLSFVNTCFHLSRT